MNHKMKGYLPAMDEEKLRRLFVIEEQYKKGQLTAEEAREQIATQVGKVSPYHLAYIEQTMTEEQEDECYREDLHAILNMLDGLMDTSRPNLPTNHPVQHYLRENDEMRKLLLAVEDLVQYPMIVNQWKELYDSIGQYPIHYHRKQNQLYPLLEKKGFMRPSTTMWTYDDRVRDAIRQAQKMLEEGCDETEFVSLQQRLVEMARDLMDKEEMVLFPTSMAMISPEEWEDMKEGDREIGFAFFTPEAEQPKRKPMPETNSSLANDLLEVLTRHGVAAGNSGLLQMATGELSLEQVNLIFRHLPIDISYVDENELVRFYSDTDHRIFPRSKNVIGREVMNCHPRKSAHVVREVIDKLRSGEQQRAEFWINKPGLFIYILYVAVRDAEGRFRGVLEVMQDCTHIRELEGSQTLLTWQKEQQNESDSEPTTQENQQNGATVATDSSSLNITPDTKLSDLLARQPKLRQRLKELNPDFRMLATPLGKVMAGRATVAMMSERSGMDFKSLKEGITRLINELENEKPSQG